ncbi:hypothetical protein [Paraburkholderia phenoliruptrix]|uniref:hypothetical protein n=1 Tax=Paraburkholderia phenoliruptrix TaxID=252970 RepID=UPI0034CF1207
MPKKFPEEQKREILRAISEHLAIEGPQNWDPLIERLGISRPTLFKFVKEVRGISGSDAAPGLLRLAQKQIKEVVQPIVDAKEEVAKHLPAVPSPNTIAHKGQAAIVHVDFMTRLESLYQDAEMIREYSIVRDENGKQKIKNPVFFASSIKQRRELLETFLHSVQEVYDLNRMQSMFDTIVDEIGRADPELARKVIDRLRELNNRYGLTMEARIS